MFPKYLDMVSKYAYNENTDMMSEFTNSVGT